MLDEAAAAAEFLRGRTGAARLGLVGLSMGGFNAARLAARDASVEALVLWAAVASAENLILAMTGAPSLEAVASTCPFDHHGNAVGVGFVRSAAGLFAPAELRGWRGRALVVQGTADEEVPPSDAREYSAALGDRAKLVLVEGASHTFNAIPHEGRVLSETVSFLREALG